MPRLHDIDPPIAPDRYSLGPRELPHIASSFTESLGRAPIGIERLDAEVQRITYEQPATRERQVGRRIETPNSFAGSADGRQQFAR